jgi:acyl-CoA synthetase (AMP-forming)/AMP-acid ligase II
MISGSAPLPPFALQEYKRRWGIEIVNNWGRNEGTNLISGPVTSSLEERMNFPQFGKKGEKWPCEAFFGGIETKIVDERGKELTEPGEVGELLYKAPSVIPCYFKQPEMTKAAFEPDDFFHTGDLFKIEENNFVSFFDRMKDIIIRGGFNISAQEVENAVLAHPKVKDAAAVAMPDEVMGEKTCIYVVPNTGEAVTLEEITSFMREQGIAVYKLPERLEIIDEIPRNPVGKILKTQLREDVKEKLGKQT